ncbi:hypothetical protein B5M10_16880 [Pluralibacter gergoviae]|uniref:DUF1471 domain-containing protein n=1 Tax=Pluralibacter gergoviae TaxID=61647 RepID=UPI0005ECEF06|nr:DUF1471 domain-containing protein [Pluralibacter gergoviae]KJM63168.1 hypothetical protein SS31_13160 [Pluralibacter gergoviae]OUQ97734.1 hypothetical protein B5M10_16880 [Pluralibacter gergoviae]
MKKLVLATSLLASVFSFGAIAAQQISQQEVDHFKLVKLGTVSVSQTGGAVSSPSDLHNALSKKADEKGGTYYRVIAGRQHGPNFEAIAEVYKDANK